MEQEALRLSYDQAVEEGYNGDIAEFYTLLQTNTEAVDLAYNMAKEEGYKNSQKSFEVLLGLKKKEENFPELFPSEYQSSNLPSDVNLNINKKKEPVRIKRLDPTVKELSLTEQQQDLIQPESERKGRVNQIKVTESLLEKSSLNNKVQSILKTTPSDTPEGGMPFDPDKPYIVNRSLMVGQIISEMPELNDIKGEDELNTFLENNPDVIEKFEQKVKEKLQTYIDNTPDDSIYKYKDFDPSQSVDAQTMMGALTNKISKKADGDPDKLAVVERSYSGVRGFNLNELTNYFDEAAANAAGLAIGNNNS